MTFFRGSNIGSSLRITYDSCCAANSLIERLDLLERLLQVLDEDVPVSPQVALVPDADKICKESMQVVHIRFIEGLVVQRVDRPDPLPPAIFVVMFALAVFERHSEMGLAIRLNVVHLQRVPDAALVHRAVEKLNGLDGRRIETVAPVPVAVRVRVRAHGPVLVSRLDVEVLLDLLEALL